MRVPAPSHAVRPTRVLRHTFIALSQNAAARRLVTRSRLLRPAVRRFIAGETVAEALQVVAGLNGRGLLATLDVLGEATTTEAEARTAAAAYAGILAAINARGLRANVSLKLSQMGLDLSPDLACGLLQEIARGAGELGNFVRVDMEDSSRLPATLQVFDCVWDAGFRNVGIVLQAYLYRTPEDLERYAGRGVNIRLCKGAYDEPPSRAFPDKRDVDRQFARLAARLLTGGSYAAIATHDEHLITQARAVAAAEGVPTARYEFQMLHGIRRDLQEQLVQQGYRVRVYVPFGLHWYPYVMRRLAERPANLFFLTRNLLRA